MSSDDTVDITVELINTDTDTSMSPLIRPTKRSNSKRKSKVTPPTIDINNLFGSQQKNQREKLDIVKQTELNHLFGIHIKEIIEIKRIAQETEDRWINQTAEHLVTTLIAPEELNDADVDQKKRIARLLRQYDISPTEHVIVDLIYGATSKMLDNIPEETKGALSNFQGISLSMPVIMRAREKYPLEGESADVSTMEMLGGYMSRFKDIAKDGGFRVKVDKGVSRKLCKNVRRCITDVAAAAIDFIDDTNAQDCIVDLEL